MTDYTYDAAFPNVPAILARRPKFINAYTDGPHAYTAAEITQIRAAGCGILWNHERAQSELLNGKPGGVAAANAAVAAVVAQGTPSDGSVAIFYSVDVNVPASEYPLIDAAFDGINALHAGRFLAGVYGEGALIDRLVASGRVQVKGWLSAASSWPGFNAKDANVGEVQLVGSDVANTDKDQITDALHLGVWWPAGHAPDGNGALITSTAPPAASTTDTEDTDDMKFRLIQAPDNTIYAYNFAGLFWKVPDMGWVAEAQADADYAGGPVAVDAARLDFIKAMCDAAIYGPSNQVGQILTLLSDSTSGVVVELAAVKAAIALLPVEPTSPAEPITVPTDGPTLSGVLAQLGEIETTLAGLPASVRAILASQPLKVSLATTGEAA